MSEKNVSIVGMRYVYLLKGLETPLFGLLHLVERVVVGDAGLVEHGEVKGVAVSGKVEISQGAEIFFLRCSVPYLEHVVDKRAAAGRAAGTSAQICLRAPLVIVPDPKKWGTSLAAWGTRLDWKVRFDLRHCLHFFVFLKSHLVAGPLQDCGKL